MKRKIALALASLMTLSAMSMNTFAASSNNLSIYTASIPRYTMFVERNWSQSSKYVRSAEEAFNTLSSDEQKVLAKAYPTTFGSSAWLSANNRFSVEVQKVNAVDIWTKAQTWTDWGIQITSGGAIATYAANQVDVHTLVSNLTSALAVDPVGKGSNILLPNLHTIDRDLDTTAYMAEGGNFTLRLDTSVSKGNSFVVELSGAEWFFRQNNAVQGNFGDAARNATMTKTTGGVTDAIAVDVNVIRARQAAVYDMIGTVSNPDLSRSHLPYPNVANPSNAARRYTSSTATNQLPKINYDPANGWYWPTTDVNGANPGAAGVYYRYGNKQASNLNYYQDQINEDVSALSGYALTGNFSDITDTFISNAAGTSRNELAYALVVSRLEHNRATVVLLEDGQSGDGIVIPMAIRATTDGNDVTITIRDASVGGVFNTGTWRLTSTSATATNATAVDSRTAMYSFENFGINIKETRLGSIRTDFDMDGRYAGSLADTSQAKKSSTIQIVAPTGFSFTKLDQIEVGLEYGLTWGRTGTARTGNGVGVVATRNNKGTAAWDYLSTNSSGSQSYVPYERYVTGNYDYVVGYQTSSYDEYEDYSVLEITLYNVTPSRDVMGNLYIRKLYMYADSDAATGDINLTLKNKNKERLVVSEQTFKAATRNEYAVVLSTTTAVPTLIAGRYEIDQTNGAGYGMLNATDVFHKTAAVKWEERVAQSWWAERETVFTLSENAKFRKIEFTASSNMQENDKFEKYGRHTTSVPTYNEVKTVTDNKVEVPNGVYINDNVKHGKVTLSDRTLTLMNVAVSRGDRNDNRASITFQPWVSIEVGHGERDVTLTSSYTSYVGITQAGEEKQSVVIAKAIDPITVSATITDLKIGYQYQSTQKVEITENVAGALMRNKQMLVTVTDMISMDMVLTPEATITVAEGDLKISSITSFNNGYATREGYSLYGGIGSASSSGGTLGFMIERASTKASKIVIDNVAVKVDRAVPESNDRAYHVVVWGSAVAENFGQNRDEYSGRTVKTDAGYDIYGLGISAPYVKVVSVSPEKTGILTGEVHVSIGENYILVDGNAVEMDAAAYISPASNSTMVPIRFVANAFGVTNDQIIYDEVNRTVTLIHPTRTIQFTTGSAKMLVNGAEVTMVNAEGVPVVAENKGDRMYIPFRFIGNAFGVYVDWDPTTQTAKYIPQN